ncbi:unnamed protein product [Diabrotica balteata]|uniref:Uncharacterized protein n=1 Tax=Diabrotica balteata TaxID=107213 RepID=A0A9N9TCM9_DIABA|nr:unnamed protein product [Diabrotica balteata]
MQSHIVKGFSKCGLYPFNPDSVDYTLSGVSEKTLTVNDFEAARRVIESISNNLIKYGVNVDVVIIEIKFQKSLLKKDSNTIIQPYTAPTTSADQAVNISVGSIVPMDHVTLLPVDIIEFEEGDAKDNKGQTKKEIDRYKENEGVNKEENDNEHKKINQQESWTETGKERYTKKKEEILGLVKQTDMNTAVILHGKLHDITNLDSRDKNAQNKETNKDLMGKTKEVTEDNEKDEALTPDPFQKHLIFPEVSFKRKKHIIYCEICKSDVDISNSGRSNIKAHLGKKKHTLVANAVTRSNKLHSFFKSASVSSENFIIAAKEGTFAYHTIRHMHSFRSLDCTSKLISNLFESKFCSARTKSEAIVKNILARESQLRLEVESAEKQPAYMSSMNRARKLVSLALDQHQQTILDESTGELKTKFGSKDSSDESGCNDPEPTGFSDSSSEYAPNDISLHSATSDDSSTKEELYPVTGDLSVVGTSDGRQKKRPKKGQGDPSKWKRAKNALSRLKGESYLGFQKNSDSKHQESSMANGDYEQEQRRLQTLWDELLSDEDDKISEFEDIYLSDEYVPDSSDATCSDEEIPTKLAKKFETTEAINVERELAPSTRIASRNKQPSSTDKEVLEILSKAGQKLDSITTSDTFDTYRKHIADRLRQMKPGQVKFVQKLISDVLFEGEMESLNGNCKLKVTRQGEIQSLPSFVGESYPPHYGQTISPQFLQPQQQVAHQPLMEQLAHLPGIKGVPQPVPVLTETERPVTTSSLVDYIPTACSTPRRTASEKDQEEPSSTDSNLEEANEMVDDPGNSNPIPEPQNQSQNINQNIGNSSDCHLQTTPDYQPKKKFKTRSKSQQIASTARELKNLSETILRSDPTNDSEWDIYGKSVAAQIKCLSPAQALTAQMEINNILTKCRFNDLYCNSTGSGRVLTVSTMCHPSNSSGSSHVYVASPELEEDTSQNIIITEESLTSEENTFSEVSNTFGYKQDD